MLTKNSSLQEIKIAPLANINELPTIFDWLKTTTWAVENFLEQRTKLDITLSECSKMPYSEFSSKNKERVHDWAHHLDQSLITQHRSAFEKLHTPHIENPERTQSVLKLLAIMLENNPYEFGSAPCGERFRGVWHLEHVKVAMESAETIHEKRNLMSHYFQQGYTFEQTVDALNFVLRARNEESRSLAFDTLTMFTLAPTNDKIEKTADIINANLKMIKKRHAEEPLATLLRLFFADNYDVQYFYTTKIHALAKTLVEKSPQDERRAVIDIVIKQAIQILEDMGGERDDNRQVPIVLTHAWGIIDTWCAQNEAEKPSVIAAMLELSLKDYWSSAGTQPTTTQIEKEVLALPTSLPLLA